MCSDQNPSLDIASKCVESTLTLQKKSGSALLAMGEHHDKLSHQITQASVIRQLAETDTPTTLFVELPHNRLHILLIDRGYSEEDAAALYKHITEQDTNGHITAKAIIGGNVNSVRGGFFQPLECQVPLHAAITNNAKIVCTDAARVYPLDHCLNYDDPSTADVVNDLNARTGIFGEMGPDDMLIRNTHMAGIIKRSLDHGDVGVLATGAAHVFGIEDEENGFHTYQDSLAVRFDEMSIPAIMLSMPSPPALPRDYEQSINQPPLFLSPSPSTPTVEMSDKEINGLFEDSGLDSKTYDPRNFAEQYRIELNQILQQAEKDLGIKGTTNKLHLQTIVPDLKTPAYCPTN